VVVHELPLADIESLGMGVVKIGVLVTAPPGGTTMRSAWTVVPFVLNVEFENTVIDPVEGVR
jgi:hypothetical protein